MIDRRLAPVLFLIGTLALPVAVTAQADPDNGPPGPPMQGKPQQMHLGGDLDAPHTARPTSNPTPIVTAKPTPVPTATPAPTPTPMPTVAAGDTSPRLHIGGSRLSAPLLLSVNALAGVKHAQIATSSASGSFSMLTAIGLADLPGVDRFAHTPATIVVLGAGGASSTFPSTELLDEAGNPRVFLVDAVDGKPLAPPLGPFRLIVVAGGLHARALPAVREIDVLPARSPR